MLIIDQEQLCPGGVRLHDRTDPRGREKKDDRSQDCAPQQMCVRWRSTTACARTGQKSPVPWGGVGPEGAALPGDRETCGGGWAPPDRTSVAAASHLRWLPVPRRLSAILGTGGPSQPARRTLGYLGGPLGGAPLRPIWPKPGAGSTRGGDPSGTVPKGGQPTTWGRHRHNGDQKNEPCKRRARDLKNLWHTSPRSIYCNGKLGL